MISSTVGRTSPSPVIHASKFGIFSVAAHNALTTSLIRFACSTKRPVYTRRKTDPGTFAVLAGIGTPQAIRRTITPWAAAVEDTCDSRKVEHGTKAEARKSGSPLTNSSTSPHQYEWSEYRAPTVGIPARLAYPAA